MAIAACCFSMEARIESWAKAVAAARKKRYLTVELIGGPAKEV
jgi:hypothetical protein